MRPSCRLDPCDNAEQKGYLAPSEAALTAIPSPTAPSVSTAVFIAIAIAALYLGREFFIPFGLAILLSFMLAPLVAKLRCHHVPRIPAIILTVVLAIGLIGGLSVVVGSQVVTLAKNLPSYQFTIQEKIRSLKANAPGGGIVERAMQVFRGLGSELSGADDAKRSPSSGPASAQQEPVLVRVEQTAQPLTIIQHVLGAVWGPIGTAGLVVIFVIFILFEREDLRDRFIRLAGRDIHRTTEALNEAAKRVSRYLLMQLAVNVIYGIPVGIGLYFIGVPNPFLWGMLAAVLRFIPYLGPFVAALFPIALAFAVDPGWSMLLWTVGLILLMELISNNVVEPWLYGSSTGLSSIAIIIAAIFWTALWGPIGLIMATPITVCLVVIGRYVPQLEFLGLLLGSEPALTPEEQFYQRLTAGNTEGAVELAESFISKKPVDSFYDEVCLPALRLAEIDRQQGNFGMQSRKVVAHGVLTVVRDLDEREDTTVAESGSHQSVLFLAGRGEHDAAVSAMVMQMLDLRGIAARSIPAAAIAPETIGALDLAGVDIVVLSYLHPAPQQFARYVCRRLRRHAPNVKLVLGFWNLSKSDQPQEAVIEEIGAERIVSSVSEATQKIEGLIMAHGCKPMVAAPIPANEHDRLEALHDSGLLEARCGGHLDRIARKVADAFETPIALVTLVDESCQLWKGASGLPEDLANARSSSRETSICGHVVAADTTLVIEDTTRDPRFANNPFLRERNIRFYAGAPLRTKSGYVIGSLCVIDTKPRRLTSRDVKLLQVIADELMADVQRPELIDG